MSTKKIELNVSINSQKCKTGLQKALAMAICFNSLKCKSGLLTAVAKHIGVDEVKLDAEKGILTVVGSVDPVRLVSKLRKDGYFAEITSIGPPKEPDDKTESSEKDDSDPCNSPCNCNQCQLVAVSYVTDSGAGCLIL